MYEKLFIDEGTGVYVVGQVANVLGELGDKKAVETLIGALENKSKYVLSQVANALGKLGDKRALKPLKQALEKETDEYVIDEIKKTLKKLEDRDE